MTAGTRAKTEKNQKLKRKGPPPRDGPTALCQWFSSHRLNSVRASWRASPSVNTSASSRPVTLSMRSTLPSANCVPMSSTATSVLGSGSFDEPGPAAEAPNVALGCLMPVADVYRARWRAGQTWCRVHRRCPLTVQTSAVMMTPRPTPTTRAASAKTAAFMVSPAHGLAGAPDRGVGHRWAGLTAQSGVKVCSFGDSIRGRDADCSTSHETCTMVRLSWSDSAPGRNRTCDLGIRRRSYLGFCVLTRFDGFIGSIA
jgi:hypothetical protein